MVQAGVVIAGVIVTAYLTYLGALRAWRRQQRLEVYGTFVAALNELLHLLDLLLVDQEDYARLDSLPDWPRLRAAAHAESAALAQLRLVAPDDVAARARLIDADLNTMIFTRGEMPVIDLGRMRGGAQYATWTGLGEFIDLARPDLSVQRWSFLRRLWSFVRRPFRP